MPQRSKTISKFTYILGLIVIFAAVYSQYFVHGRGVYYQLLVVYGLPIVAVTLIFGGPILRKAFKNNTQGFTLGVAYFGVAVVLSYFVVVGLIALISQLQPQALVPLGKSMPFLQISQKSAWLMVLISMLVIGPAEEYLFRGFVFGGMLKLFKNQHWMMAAFYSSLLFALAHLYYFFIFGLVSIIFFIDIVAVGMALAFAYYYSKGNLVAPAFIHGFFDATSFLNLATGTYIGILLRLLMAVIGIFLAIYLGGRYLVRRIRAAA